MVNSPIRVITVEREFGSRGGEFAHELASRLGWRLLDSELLTAAARKACVPEDLAAQFDDRLDPWYYRYGRVFWQDQLYSTATEPEDKVFNCERMYALIKQEILDQAKVGNCVIVGRGGAPALAGKPGVFTFSCMPPWLPSGRGLRRTFPIAPCMPTRSWSRGTSAAPPQSSSITGRSGVRAAFITCC